MRPTIVLPLFALAFNLLAFRAAAQAPIETLSIPIYLINDKAGTGGIEYKIGIMLKLGDDENNNGYRMYEFDTGGIGFWAAHSTSTGSNTWSHSDLDPDPISITYASGNMLIGNSVTAKITFEEGLTNTDTPYTAHVDATIAKISSGTNPGKAASNPINTWETTVDHGDAPIESYFYGDFGMSLGSGTNGLLAIVPQLLGTQNTGFTINIGSLPDAAMVASSTNFIIQTGKLQIGLTAAQKERSSWSQVVDMQGGTNSPRYPNSGQNTYQEVLSSGTLTISGTSGTNSYSTGIVYDTGAPSTVIHTGTSTELTDEINAQLSGTTGIVLTGTTGIVLTGTTGIVLTGTTPGSLILDINPTGTIAGMNVVSGTTTDAINYPNLYVNTGITAFFGHEVVYNIEDGFVGFQSIPEPGVGMLFGTGIAGLAAWMIRRRRTRR